MTPEDHFGRRPPRGEVESFAPGPIMAPDDAPAPPGLNLVQRRVENLLGEAREFPSAVDSPLAQAVAVHFPTQQTEDADGDAAPSNEAEPEPDEKPLSHLSALILEAINENALPEVGTVMDPAVLLHCFGVDKNSPLCQWRTPEERDRVAATAEYLLMHATPEEVHPTIVKYALRFLHKRSYT